MTLQNEHVKNLSQNVNRTIAFTTLDFGSVFDWYILQGFQAYTLKQ